MHSEHRPEAVKRHINSVSLSSSSNHGNGLLFGVAVAGLIMPPEEALGSHKSRHFY